VPGETGARLTIAEAAAAVAMHPQTLRKYERAGLLRPARRNGGSRHYAAEDIARLGMIKNLAEVRRINVAGMALALALHDKLVALLEAIAETDAETAANRVREQLPAMVNMIAEGETGSDR
jgi:MerR family transcriptional regulator, heat shock protein HspR